MDIYLDNHSFSQPAEYAIKAAHSYLHQIWGSAHAIHDKGKQIRAHTQELSTSICDLLSPSYNHKLFFFSSYEEMNFRLYAYFRMHSAKITGKNHILVWEDLSSPVLQDCIVEKIPQENSLVDLDALKEVLTPKTGMVILPFADGYTGLIQPLEEVAALCHEKGIHLHIDITHAIGKLPLYLKDYPELSFGFSSHTLHTPFSAGLLFFPEDSEDSFFHTSIQLPLLASVNVAARHAHLYLDKMALDVAFLRNKLEEAKEAAAEFASSYRLPNVALLTFKDIHNEMLLYRLNKRGVYAHLVEQSFSALSFALSRFTTKEMIEKTLDIIEEEIANIRLQTKGVFHVGSL